MASDRYIEDNILLAAGDGASVDATATYAVQKGFGRCNQIALRIEAGDVTGGADTLDCKLQYRIAGTWVDLITMTQLTAAGGETKVLTRSATLATGFWTDDLQVVLTVGAGATATGVDVVVVGAVA